VNEENLSNMYARIRFVEEYLEGKSGGVPQHLSSKRSHKKLADGEKGGEDDKQVESRKRVKGNE